MAAEPPVGHPCHQLSNPSARMFWCRHCMTGFPDPMQRWRHSKECKAISSQKKYGGLNPPNHHTGMLPLFPKYDSPTPSPQSDTSTPNKKKKSMDLKCYICKKEFITINEMRDHVKRPCNKPEIKNTLKDTYDSLILTNEEDSDDSVTQNEDKVTNQIETLLKAAQILQQKKDQLMATSKQTTMTTILGHRRIPENIDVEDSPYVCNTEGMVLDLGNKRPYDNKDEFRKQFTKVSEDNQQQALDNADKLGNALKIYDFISDTPEPSPCPPDMLPGQQEASPYQPEMSPCQLELDNNDDQVSTESLNKTYVSSLQPQTSDSNKIPKITLKLVSGDKPKAEVWGIGTDLPKRIRKRKSKDFFDDTPAKVKKKEITLKEMQDKLIKNKTKQKVEKKKLSTNVKEKECKTIPAEGGEVMKTEDTKVNEKETKNDKVKKELKKVKKKEVKNTTRPLKTRNGKIVGKKNLVVVLTDCLSNKKSTSANNSRRQNKANNRSMRKSINGKQKPVLKAKTTDKSKTKSGMKGTSSVNSDKTKTKKDNLKTNKQLLDKRNDKSKTVSTSSNSKIKSVPKQKPVSKPKVSDPRKVASQKLKNDKPVKCKACDRVFRTRDLLVKHNQIPCRMRNTRNMTQIILRPKKHVSHTLPLTQRQINAAKRRKQVAGKLSILDNSVKKDDVPIGTCQSEKSEKPKKPARNRKRLASPYFTFCITPKDKNQFFDPVDFDSLSEKNRYFFKLGMFPVSLRKQSVDDTEVIENDKDIINMDDFNPREITIHVDANCEVQSLPSLTSVGSEISPPILEKVSEISVECDGHNEKDSNLIKMHSSQVSPPDLVHVHGAAALLKGSENRSHRKTKPPCFDIMEKSSIGGTTCSTSPQDGASLLMTDTVLLKTVNSPTIANGASSSLYKNSNSSQLEEVNRPHSADDENNKENRGDNYLSLILKKKDVGVSCNSEDILNELEKSKYFEDFGFGFKLIKPNSRSFGERTCFESDISSQSRASHFVTDVKSGTNRKLMYTVTLGIQTEQSFLKTKTRWLNKSLEMESASCKEKLKEKFEERNLFHSIEDLIGAQKDIGVPKDKDIPKDICVIKDIGLPKDIGVPKIVVAKYIGVPKDIGVPKNIGVPKDIGVPKNIGVPKDIGVPKNIGVPKDIGVPKNIGVRKDIGVPKNTGVPKDIGVSKNIGMPKDIGMPKYSSGSKYYGVPKDIGVLKYSSVPKYSGVSKDTGVPKYSSVPKDMGVPKDKNEIVSQDTFIESLLPATKVTFDDIFEMDDMENSPNLTKISEKSNYTEVEITLPNKSKVAQLYTDIDWLALSDSDDAQPMKSVSPKIRLKEVKRKHSSLSKGALITGTENKATTSSESSLNKVIPNFPDKYKHVCDINISSPSNESMIISENPKTLNSKSKIEEVYIYPKKPINTGELEPVVVSNAKPSKVDEQMNLQTSNNLLDLIAKTMGIIPESAKQKFEKSVMSLLTTATSPSDTSEIDNSASMEDSKVIIMNSTFGAEDFTSDITVIDERPQFKNDLPERVGNDHVIRPSNFCNVSSFVSKSSDLVTKMNSSSSQLFTFSNLESEPMDLNKNSSVDNLSNRTTHDKTVTTTAGENYNKDGRLLASPVRYSATNLDVKSNSIANKRRSPRPPNIIANDLTHLDVFNNGSKDDIVNALSDQESPTLVTNFDFEKYAEHLKEETFYTTEPLSPIRPVSLTPSCDQTLKDNFDVKSPPKCNYSSPVTTVISRNVDLIHFSSPQKEAQKSEVFLKPLAIDCSQNKEDESYICDISPPLEGPTQNISPVDLAKVATAKMTNELILKSQGFGQGLLQMSNNRPMHSPNIAFLPQKNAQLYVSPKLYNPVDHHKRSQDNICRNRSQESFGSPKVQSPFEGNLGGVQFIDIHLNTYNQNPVSSPKSNFHDRRNSSGATLNIDSWDKRQNVIVSSSFNQGKPPHTIDSKDLHVASPQFTQVKPKQIVERRDLASPTYSQIRPKNVNERQDASKQKPRHSVNILRSYNKQQERRQDLQQEKTNSNPSHQHSSLMSPAFNMPEKAKTGVNNSSKSTGFLTCDTQQQDALLDMLDKSDKSPNHFVSGMLTSSGSSNEKFQFRQIHPNFASHQRRRVQTPEKSIPSCPKSNINMDNFPGFQQNEVMLLNSRIATEQSHLKTKSKFECVSKIPQQEIIIRTSSASKEQVPKKTNVQGEILQRVPPQQEALMLNSRISAEQLRHRSNFSNINRSRSFDQPSVKNDFSFHTVSENSVICSPTINSSCNYSNAPKGSVFDYKNSLKSVEQKQNQGLACTVSSRIDYTSHINDNERFNFTQVQRQLSAPSNLGNKSRTSSTNIMPNPDYEDVSSPEEVEVYPTTPRAKEIPQKTLPPYRLENETLSLHSVDKGQSSPQVSIPHSFNFKSSLEQQVQYREQRSLLESGNRMFPEQRTQRQQTSFYQNMPSRHVQKNREVFETPVQFSEFCPNDDISDSILDNI